jgi:hypothetical protein
MPNSKNNKGKSRPAKSGNLPTKSNRSGTRASSSHNSLVATNFTSKVPKAMTLNVSSAVEAVCSMTDPFCNTAKGSKWMDGAGLSCLPAQVRGHLPYGTNSYGGNIVYINPGMDYTYIYPGGATSTTYTLANYWSGTPGGANVSQYSSECRLVSAGIIVRNVAPALTTCGYLIINRLSDAPLINATVPVGNVYGIRSATHPICAGMEIPLVFLPQGSAARSFKINSIDSVPPSIDWDTISLEIVGAPALAVVLDIEIVYNFEFKLTNTNVGISQFIPAASPNNPLYTQVSNKVTVALGDLAYEGAKEFGRTAIRKISDMLMSSGGTKGKVLGAAGYMSIPLLD